jgi:hypothetical protein
MVGQQSLPSERIVFDDTRWPIVEMRLPSRPLTDAEFEETIRSLYELSSRGGRFGFVVDARHAPEPDAKRRRAIGELMDALQKAHGADFIGVALAISSGPARAVFKALLWLRQGTTPMLAVASPEEGFKKLQELSRTRTE